MLAALVFDLDGTLVDAQGKMHPQDAALLRRAAQGELGHLLFVPATGRPLHSVRQTFERNGVTDGAALPFPLILQNGSLVLGAGEKPLSFLPFAEEVRAELAAAALARPACGTFFFTSGPIYLLHPSPLAAQMDGRFHLEAEPVVAAPQQPFSKVMVAAEPPELAALVQAVAALPLEVAYSLENLLEINPRGIDKGRAVEALLTALALPDLPVYAAGDGENDLALFRRARRSYAPATGLPQVQAQAARVLDAAPRGLLTPLLEDANLGAPPTSP